MVLKPILHSLLVVELRHLSCFLIFHQKRLQNSNKKHQNDASATKRRVQHGSQTKLSCSASGGNVARVCFFYLLHKKTPQNSKNNMKMCCNWLPLTQKKAHTLLKPIFHALLCGNVARILFSSFLVKKCVKATPNWCLSYQKKEANLPTSFSKPMFHALQGGKAPLFYFSSPLSVPTSFWSGVAILRP